MIKPKQYLLVGLPYSGKTTLANELKEKLGFAHINIDQIKFDEGYRDRSDSEVPNSVWKKIFKKSDSLIVNLLNEGKNVANEYAWITKKWRNRARNAAKKAGYETKVIYIKIPLRIIKQRWIKNSKHKKRFQW